MGFLPKIIVFLDYVMQFVKRNIKVGEEPDVSSSG
jgi:hypothetical protein